MNELQALLVVGSMGMGLLWSARLVPHEPVDQKTTRALRLQIEELRASLHSREDLEAELRYLAFHDPLTGLANRALFEEHLDHALTKRRRNRQLMGVMMVDLDHLKAINDLYGHQVGDGVLETVAARITQSLRASDTAARLGGDEFGVILDEMVDVDQASLIAARISASVKQPMSCQGHRFRTSVSIGVALVDGPDGDVRELIRRADVAMYRAKSKWRGHCVVWTPTLDDVPRILKPSSEVIVDEDFVEDMTMGVE